MAPLPPLAEPEAVETLLEVNLTEAGIAKVELLLNLVSGAMRRRMGNQQITQSTSTIRRPGPWGDTLVLPQWPIVSVTSVKLGDSTLDPSGYQVISEGLFRSGGVDGESSPNGQGATNLSSGSWGGPSNQYEITYVHGHPEDEIPYELQGICIQAAIRSIDPQSQGVTTESLEDWAQTRSVDFARLGIGGFTEEEKDILKSWPRPTFQP